MTCVIVIPVYKSFEALTVNEKKSIEQCFHILGQYTVFFVAPASLDVKTYQEFAIKANSQFNYRSFDDRYFASIEGYNNLLLAVKFYQAFAEYEHLLLYQPDAYLFRDELEQWCKSGYDFIGAPWFEGYTYPVSTKMIGVGNGGFSLRNIAAHIRMLKKVKRIKKIQSFCSVIDNKKFSFSLLLMRLLNTQLKIKSPEHLYYLNEEYFLNEDAFWGRNMGTIFSDFHVAPAEDAMRFSFEANPSFLYKLTNSRLPFGCHAWEKHEPHFWQQFIDNSEAV